MHLCGAFIGFDDDASYGGLSTRAQNARTGHYDILWEPYQSGEGRGLVLGRRCWTFAPSHPGFASDPRAGVDLAAARACINGSVTHDGYGAIVWFELLQTVED